MEILAAYDLTESFRAAAEIAGCSHHTVAKHVSARDAGRPIAEPGGRGRVTDPFLPKIEEWVEASRGRIRGDKAHDKLVALGYEGSERSTRRAIAQVRAAWRLGHVRVHQPWITEPGHWLQYDFGDGPVIDGKKTVLFVAWLAWSRFRIVIALRDRTAPSVFAALDRSFRILGGAPTYVLTDNEKTVTVSHVAGVPVRNQQTVSFAHHYGVTVLTCQPADPATKGGVESSVKVAKADIVPKDTNLRPEYGSFAEIEAACEAFMNEVNNREHRVTRRKPAMMLAEETPRLHRVPEAAHTVAFGLSRTVPDNTPMVTFENGQYSVPAHLLGARVFVRAHGVGTGEQIIIVHHGAAGPVEVARHLRARPGSPSINDDHFPDHRPKIPGEYTPRPRSKAEVEFLAIGDGARTWLLEAAAAGTARMNTKMAEAVTLAKMTGTAEVDKALGVAAVHDRFATGDLASILNAAGTRRSTHAAGETKSLTQGTARVGRHRPNRQCRTGGDRMSAVTAAAPALPADLEALMRQLKMPYARALAPELIATAKAQRWEPVEVIKALFVEEVTGRSRSMLATRRKAAGFPTGKTFDTWDESVSSIPAPTQQALRTLEWIGRKENVVVCGPSGTGKTFFLEALGQQVVEAGMRVAWFALEDLGALMRAHRSDDTAGKVVARILRADLVVVDDIGLLPVSVDAAEGLYRLVDAAYEKRSIAVSSNLHPSGFDELMPKTLATATVDRLLHHAHVCQTSGDSIRLTQALAGKGVTPMN